MHMLKLAPGLLAGTLLLVFAILALGVVGGLAAECPHGTILASWYGRESCQRSPCRTADGTPFDGTQMVAASLSLPMGSIVRVTMPGGRSVVVRIADRGPARWTGRKLDLSKAAAARLGIIKAGTACVTVERIG